MKINVAIIGAGAIARNVHAPYFLSNKNVNLTAVVDSDLKRAKSLGKKFQIAKTYSDVDSLFSNENVDAVSICTPPNSHEEILSKAFDHNCSVLCEKPLTTDVEAGKRMLKTVRNRQLVFMVGFHRRFIPNYRNAKAIIQEGGLGKVYCIEDHFLEPHPLFGWAKAPWYVEPGVGGAINDVASHVFDMFNYLFDAFPESVTAVGTTHLHSQVEEFCSFIAEYPNSRVGVGTIGWLSPSVEEYTSIFGTGQSIRVSAKAVMPMSPTSVREISELRSSLESLITMKYPNLSILRNRTGNPYLAEINRFISRVINKDTSKDSALNALSVLSACEATKIAIKNHCKVQIESPL